MADLSDEREEISSGDETRTKIVNGDAEMISHEKISSTEKRGSVNRDNEMNGRQDTENGEVTDSEEGEDDDDEEESEGSEEDSEEESTSEGTYDSEDSEIEAERQR